MKKRINLRPVGFVPGKKDDDLRDPQKKTINKSPIGKKERLTFRGNKHHFPPNKFMEDKVRFQKNEQTAQD